MSIRGETQILFFITARHKNLTYILWPHNLVVSHNSLRYVDITYYNDKSRVLSRTHQHINGWMILNNIHEKLQPTLCASCEIQLIGLPCDTFVWSISLQLEIIYFTLTIFRLSNNQSFPPHPSPAGSFPTYRNILISAYPLHSQTLTVFPIAIQIQRKVKWIKSALRKWLMRLLLQEIPFPSQNTSYRMHNELCGPRQR